MNKLTSATLSVVIGGGLVAGMATNAQAATSIRAKALSIATQQKGDPYKYGAAGPSKFDCSGLVMYAYGKAGKKLPRTAQQQYNTGKKISPSNRRVGDLIGIRDSGGVYHIGIFAGVSNGYGYMWDAPKPGRTVGKHKVQNYTGGKSRWAVYSRIVVN